MNNFTVIFAAIGLAACSSSPKSTGTTPALADKPIDDGIMAPDTSTPAVPVYSMESGPMADTSLGLTPTSVFDSPAPELYAYPVAEPGKNQNIPRGYYGAPPAIPHQVAEFLPITLDENTCHACHEVAKQEPNGPTPIPASHYVDYRNNPGQKSSDMYNARWRCMACHVAPSDAPPLVDNLFIAEP